MTLAYCKCYIYKDPDPRYNIFHPLDPVAYRLEPLFSPTLGCLAPQQVPLAGAELCQSEQRIDWVLQEDSSMASDVLQAWRFKAFKPQDLPFQGLKNMKASCF